jgi:hypothetical protein
LLISHILIAAEEQIEPGILSRVEQCTIIETAILIRQTARLMSLQETRKPS